jgi:membrane protein implicated in regulation of membrane protease activity
MASRVFTAAGRVRALFYLALCAFMALLMGVAAFRAAAGGDWTVLLFCAGLSFLCCWQGRRWYRAFRALGGVAPVE